MDFFGWLWIGWGLYFVVVEGAAIAERKWGGTLSDHLRLWLRTKTKRGRYIWLFSGGAFFAWFLVHIAVAGAA